MNNYILIHAVPEYPKQLSVDSLLWRVAARVSQKASPVLLWTWRWHRVSQPSAASSMRSLVKVHRSHKFAGKKLLGLAVRKLFVNMIELLCSCQSDNDNNNSNHQHHHQQQQQQHHHQNNRQRSWKKTDVYRSAHRLNSLKQKPPWGSCCSIGSKCSSCRWKILEMVEMLVEIWLPEVE